MSDKADATHHKYFKVNLPDGEGAIFCLPLLFFTIPLEHFENLGSAAN